MTAVTALTPTSHQLASVPASLSFRSIHLWGGWLMLWTICVALLVLWLLGVVSANTFGGFIHILLVLALAVVLIRVIQGRRPV